MRRRLFAHCASMFCLAGAGIVIGQGAQSQTAPERFTAMSDGHPMAVWARRPPSPRGAILLVHGRTWSSRPDFDLQVPGLQRSVLQSLSQQGFAAYALDLRGYGETKRDQTNWLTPKRAAADIANAAAWVAGQHPALPRPAVLGWSWGGAAAMLAVQATPARFSSLVLFGFAYDPDAKFADVPAPPKPLMAKNTPAEAVSDFVSPRITPQAVINAFTVQALKADPIAMDVKGDDEFNALDPAKIMLPTLILFGERDVNVPETDGGKFFARLGTSDKQMVELPGADHVAHLEDTHDAWIAAVVSFLSRPPARR